MSDDLQQQADLQRQKDVKMWAMFIHFGTLTGYVIFLAGWLVPIVIWQVKKDQMPELDAHGKMVANWIITKIIYLAAGLILSPFMIRIPILIAVPVMALAFAIIGGIKANNGEFWKYPLTIEFIK